MSDPAKPFSLDKPDTGEKPHEEALPDALVIEPRAGAGSAAIGTRHPVDGGVEQHPVHDSDVEDLARDTGFRPSTTIESGLERFVSWYRDYYSV